MRNIFEIRALKAEGHDTIDRLVRLGISRNRVYTLLARKLGKTLVDSAHFRNIYTEREARAAVRALLELERDRQTDLNRIRTEKLERIRVAKFMSARVAILERDEQAWRDLPWWRKALVVLSTRLSSTRKHWW